MAKFNSKFNSGGDRGGFRRDDRRGGGGRDFGRPTLYDATCADCGKETKVPFRPTGDREVYCRDCFAKRGGGEERGRQAGAKPWPAASKPFQTFAPVKNSSNNSNDDVKRELQEVNAKLERLIIAVQALVPEKKMAKGVAKKTSKAKNSK